MDKSCGTCRFWTTEWQDDEMSDVGQCFRFPPKIVNHIDSDADPHTVAKSTKFPVISYVRVCGEWQPNMGDIYE